MQSFKALLLGFAVAVAMLTAPAGAQNAGATDVDQTFVTQAVHGNDHEIDQASAELAIATDPGIILFAKTMIADHTASNSQIAAVARDLGLTYPKSHITTGAHGTPAPGSKAPPGAMTPVAYMTMQVAEHQAMIGLLQGEADNGSSAQLRTVSAETIPVAKAHLAMAQQFLASGTVSPEVTPTPGP